MTFDKEESHHSDKDGQEFWEDCIETKTKITPEKNKSKTNRTKSISIPKKSKLPESGRRTPTLNVDKSPNLKNKLNIEGIYFKTLQSLDEKPYERNKGAMTDRSGAATERERTLDKLANGKTLTTIEGTISTDEKTDKKVNYSRLAQLHQTSNKKKNKLNFLREEKTHLEEEKEMKECTFKPKTNSIKKYSKLEKDFLSRNFKWKDNVNTKIEKK